MLTDHTVLELVMVIQLAMKLELFTLEGNCAHEPACFKHAMFVCSILVLYLHIRSYIADAITT